MRDEGSALYRAAGWSAYLGAVVSAFGIAFLVLLYVGFFTGADGLLKFGPLNDIFIIFQYVLALPIVVAFHRLLGPRSPRLSLFALLVALVGIIGVVVFQSLLVAGLMTFLEQVTYASASILIIGVWIVITGSLGRRVGLLNLGLGTIILGALYVGYPLWVYRVGQWLLSHDRNAVE